VSKLSKAQLHRLFQLAQQLLALEPGVVDGREWVAPFLGVFGITAVCLYDAGTDRFLTLTSPGTPAPPGGDWEGQTRATYVAGQDQDDPAAGIVIRRMITAGRIIGAVAFQGLEDPERTAEPLISLAAALLERMRLRRESTEAAVTAGIGAFRSAIMDVLGSECKNALTTILAAAGGLREAGPLVAEQLEMARMVEEEASRLGGVISRLDWIARLDEGEVSPRTDSTNVSGLTAQIVDQWERIEPDRQIVFASRDTAFMAPADPELLRFALSQLLDNACKFSAPGAAVHVQIDAESELAAGPITGVEGRGGAVVVRVSSEGPPIPSHERHRIFERSYVGSQASNFAAGSGLGLYAARKIALAHRGTLDLDPEKMWTSSIAFRLSLPRANGQPQD